MDGRREEKRRVWLRSTGSVVAWLRRDGCGGAGGGAAALARDGEEAARVRGTAVMADENRDDQKNRLRCTVKKA
jgi:hypothetical protein